MFLFVCRQLPPPHPQNFTGCISSHYTYLLPKFHRMHFFMLHLSPTKISQDSFHHITPTPPPAKISQDAFCHIVPTSAKMWQDAFCHVTPTPQMKLASTLMLHHPPQMKLASTLMLHYKHKYIPTLNETVWLCAELCWFVDSGGETKYLRSNVIPDVIPEF